MSSVDEAYLDFAGTDAASVSLLSRAEALRIR